MAYWLIHPPITLNLIFMWHQMKRAVAIGLAMLPMALMGQKYMYFDHYTTREGLSSNMVTALSQDGNGHVWVATDFGLNRFNGSTFKRFGSASYPSLYRDDILYLHPQGKDGLLLGGYNGFLMRYDAKSDSFADVSPADFRQTYYKGILGFYTASDGRLFVNTSNGIYLYDRVHQRFVNSFPLYRTFVPYSICSMNIDFKGRYWMPTSNALNVFTPQGERVFHLNLPISEGLSFNTHLQAINSRLLLFTGISGKLEFFSLSPSGDISTAAMVSTPFENVRDVVVDRQGGYWMVTDGDGLWHSASIPRKSSDFVKVVPYGVRGDEFNKLYSALIDRNGNLWVGAQNSGLWCCRLTGKMGIFTSSEVGMSACISSSFANDPSGKLFVASDGAGVFSCSGPGWETRVYGPSQGLFNRNVTSLFSDGAHDIWATTWGSGLFVYHPSSGRFSRSSIPGLPATVINLFKVQRMLNGELWLFTGGDGIFVLRGGRWMPLPLHHKAYGPDPDVWAYFAAEADARHRWIFTSSTIWMDEDGRLRPIPVHYQGSSSGNLVSVLDAIHVRGKGYLVATNRGLLLFADNGRSYAPVPFAPKVAFSSLCVDRRGLIWASGAAGIMSVDFKARHCYVLPADFSDKGQNFFAYRSSFVDVNGRVYFGDKEGFFSFLPEHLPNLAAPAYLAFSDLVVAGRHIARGREMLADGSLDNNGGFELAHNQTDIEIDLDVVDFSEYKSRYVYRLLGLEDEWMEVPADHKIRFSYIPSGRYTLQVKAQRGAESTGSAGISLPITVLPPWWASWWFRLFCVLLVLLYVGYKWRALKREQLVLKQKVEERTHELSDKNLVIERRNAELNKVLSYKDRLIAVVAHDLKNPMFAIVGALEGLLRKADRTSPDDRQRVLGEVLGSARTLQNEMTRLLTWATSSQDDIEYRPANVDLEKMLADDVALLRASMKAKGLSISVDVQLSHFVFVDARMVSTAVRNIIGNAIKFTPVGKGISLKAWQQRGLAVIRIADEGVGMSPAKLEEVRSQGRHVSSEGTQGERGTGLGIGITQDYILQNNGQLDIDSVEGHGSVFTITLPLADEVLSQSVEPVTSVPSFEVNMELMEGNTILVVDDDPLICQNIKNMLDSYVSVLVANNGREALDVVSRNVVDLILSDVEMPVMNGIDMSMELAKNVQTNYIPILFLSAKSSESDRLLGLLTGAIDYIPKPFSQNELLIKMNNILALRQRQQQRLLEERLQAITHPKEEEPPVSVQPAGSVVPVPGTEMPVPAVDLPDETPAEVAAPVEEKTPVESQPSVPPVEAVMEESINPMLQSLLEVIDKNYSDSQFSVERLADLMCMTKITLYRRVKSLSGKTPVELLNDYRLNKAHQLLSTTNMPVADVAFNVGFTDPAYFTRRFHAAFHCSPSALRD